MAKQKMTKNAAIALSVISLLVATAALPALAIEIVPHQARYDIKLESLQAEGFPLEADGAMAVRLVRDCQKWESLQELRFNVGVEGGESLSISIC